MAAVTDDSVYSDCPAWCSRQHRANGYHYSSWEELTADDGDLSLQVRALRAGGEDQLELLIRNEETAVEMTLDPAQAHQFSANLKKVVLALQMTEL
ncbi:hypothetical protein Afil01_44040 [Actinorhabdospora filicis]|uniref:Uncharacterized protein n=2 Tax=Actinorhabdospora filicis TaxID=1785913 RepID=A0A9W6W4S8_9ACTN|nr:hypothetical protein Afil01_44040 [Actinorhabdospora filicis]